ncbi:MAG: phytanoyl-CoA dioxygenase family protein [Planctomycetota bacterium]
MSYPLLDAAHRAQFAADGFLVVRDAVPEADRQDLLKKVDFILENRETHAKDWDWRQGEALDKRQFRIVQCGVTPLFPDLKESAFHGWLEQSASRLMDQPMTFWYDQFLGKPPKYGAPTPWHQDEAYWGRRLFDCGITGWLALVDVPFERGCMQFVRGGHQRGMIEHARPGEMSSDLLRCEIAADDDIVRCPLKAGDVTFHHSKTPHQTGGNSTDAWRLSIANHLSAPGIKGEGSPYPWRVRVTQGLPSIAGIAAEPAVQ